MAPAVILSLGSLVLFSLADLRYRAAPGVAAFFLAAVLLGAPADPLRATLVVLAVCWGIWSWWPFLLVLPLLLYPFTWAVLLTGGGVRRGIVGRADLLALGGLACLFDWPAPALALIGVEMWRWWWRKQRMEPVPALPGMLLGLCVYLMWGIVNSCWQ
ncbi:MAG: hypothetical protein PVG14_06005 [Anaerolineales bacterium]|jgi:hypothetical protein